jgi:hypothetical protein
MNIAMPNWPTVQPYPPSQQDLCSCTPNCILLQANYFAHSLPVCQARASLLITGLGRGSSPRPLVPSPPCLALERWSCWQTLAPSTRQSIATFLPLPCRPRQSHLWRKRSSTCPHRLWPPLDLPLRPMIKWGDDASLSSLSLSLSLSLSPSLPNNLSAL